MVWLAAASAADPHLPHGPGVAWQTVETRFFRVHWVESDTHSARASAQRAAEICDGLLLRLAADAAFVPRGPYDLVVSDATEGMVAYTVPSDRRVVIGADPATAVLRLRGRVDWVEDALAHELGHLVWDRRTTPFAQTAGYGVEAVGVLEVGGLAASLDLFAVHDLPYGLSEGLAELTSERAGVNVFDERRAGLLTSGAATDRLLTWDEWLVGADKGDVLDAERAYQQGYAFVRWLGDEYGEDTLRDLAEHLATHHRWSLSRVLREVTGVEGRTSWARHRGHLRAEALARDAVRVARGAPAAVELEAWPASGGLSSADADALRPPREVEASRESTGSWELFPRTSRDGRFYAEGKARVLRVVRADDPAAPEGPAVWLPAVTGLPPVFSPDRDAVLVVTDTPLGQRPWLPAPASTRTAVWEVGLQSANGALVASTPRGLRRVAAPVPGTERARDVAVSDRGELAFVRHADSSDQLWSRPLRGPGDAATQHSTFPEHTWLQSPTFSPDGARLAVSVFRENQGELWLAELPAWRWTRVPLPFTDVLDPTWTPNGLLATAVVNGRWQVIRVAPDTGAVEVLTDTLAGASTPTFGPDGALWFSETTAAGFKSSRLPLVDLAPVAVPPAPPPPHPPLPTTGPWTSRPYRALPTPPSLGPLLRVDSGPATVGNVDGLRVAGGGWFDVHDALDTWTLEAFGLLGTTAAGSVALRWDGAGVPLSTWVSGAFTPGGDRWLGQAELSSPLAWNPGVEVEPALVWVRAGGGALLDSRRLRVVVGAPEPRSRMDPGPWADLTLTAARSQVGDTPGYVWGRAQAGLGTRAPLSWAVGPLDEQALAVELGARVGFTSTDVDPREELGVGGDLWSAWRPLALEATLPFPALPPWAATGEHVGATSARLVVPVAPRLRRAAGPVYLQGFELAPGVDAAAVWPDAALRVAVVGEARMYARLQDRTWNTSLVLAKTLDGAPPRLQLELGSAGY
jgi:hypothetical protein